MSTKSKSCTEYETTVKPRAISPLRNGGFENCAVSGEWYECPSGDRFWQVTIVSEAVNAHCFISGDEFRCAEAGISFPDFKAVTGEATDLTSEIKQGVLAVIRRWESELKNP